VNKGSTITVKMGDDAVTARIVDGGRLGSPIEYKCSDKKCHKAHKWPIMDITQHGFEWDQHTSIFRCAGCGEFTAVRYYVEFN